MLTITYLALTIFLVGNLYRIVRVMRAPAHLRWELYPMPRGSSEQQRRGSSYFEESEWWTKPHPTNRTAELRLIVGEVLLQKTVWKHNRALWPWTWLMHLGLFGALAAIGGASAASFAGHASARELVRFAATMTMAAGLAGSAGLIALRAFGSKWRPYSSRAAFANLLVLAAFFFTGAAVLLESAGGRLMDFAGALLRLTPAPELSHTASVHVAIACLFLAYFPLTHMTHAYMKFFAFHRVRWDDNPTFTDARLQAQIAANVRRPITWSAPHIRGLRWSVVVSPTKGQQHG